MRLYINKFEDKFEYLEEMDNFLRKFELSKWEFLIPSELESLSKPISIEGIEGVIKGLLHERAPDQNDFTGKKIKLHPYLTR